MGLRFINIPRMSEFECFVSSVSSVNHLSILKIVSLLIKQDNVSKYCINAIKKLKYIYKLNTALISVDIQKITAKRKRNFVLN